MGLWLGLYSWVLSQDLAGDGALWLWVRRPGILLEGSWSLLVKLLLDLCSHLSNCHWAAEGRSALTNKQTKKGMC